MIKKKKNKKRRVDYHKKNFENPFYSKKEKIHETSLKTKLIFVAVLIVFIASFWFLFFSNFFNINNKIITGLIRTPKDEIEIILNDQLNNKKLLFLSQNNLLIFDKNKFVNSLLEKYNFKEVIVKKRFFNKLEIEIKEKTFVCIWNEDDKYFYIDEEGSILEETNLEKMQKERYPIIANESKYKIENNTITIEKKDKEDLEYILLLAREFKRSFNDIKIEKLLIDNTLNTIKIFTNEGLEISFNTTKEIPEQIEKLLIVKNEKLKDEFKTKEHIDLRFGDKVFYQ